ncbi:MAG: SurA N-terminal domain-containing protein [Acidobacteriota bacterium]|jgi:hypothetical protein
MGFAPTADRRRCSFGLTRFGVLLLAAIGAAGATPAPARTQTPALADRIVAVVNGEVISSRQLERATRTAQQTGEQATEFCTPPADASADLHARVLQCMIDDLLQFQYVRRFPQFDPLPEAIDEAFSALVARYDSQAAFEEALREQDMTADEVRYDLRREAMIANYIQVRYRDLVDVTESEIQSYYVDVLQPEMERQGADLPALAAVDDELIEPLLRETEVNRRVDEWIADMRRRARIVLYQW